MSSWTVWNEMDRLRAEVDRLFGEVSGARPWRVAFLPGAAARRYPLVNVSETAGGYRAVALAPGVHPGSFEVTVKENQLTIAGEKRRTEGVASDEIHRSERAVGRFLRTIELPSAVDPDKVRATYAHGLLTIDLEKSAAAKPRQIQVHVD